MAKKIKITQIKSTIGTKPKTRATVKALGLKKISDSVIQEDNETIQGMIHKVSHIVKVEDAVEVTKSESASEKGK